MTLADAKKSAERLWWMLLVEAESFAMSTLHDDSVADSLEVVAEVRAALRDKFGVDLDEVGLEAREQFDALLKKKQEARSKRRSMERFHRHLDACERCEKQPFNLCPTGQQLLENTAASDGK